MPTAVITGITGQDGSYLAEFLLQQGYRVVGMVRRTSSDPLIRIAHILEEVELASGDLHDQWSLIELMRKYEPDEVYNLGAQSFVPTSWNQPVLTAEVTGLGVTRMLEAVRAVNPEIKFYQASSSEIFGKVREVPQNEGTPLHPRSPYGVAKAYGHWITVNYRESYGLFACCGILFNHTSPRRGLEFVSRKVSYGAARIKRGLQTKIGLGDLSPSRDWGFAGDYVKAMWLMLQQGTPDDFVVASGVTHRIQELVEIAFEHLGLDWREHVERDESMFRPAEVFQLVGDATKARETFGWTPDTSFADTVTMMVDSDLELVDRQLALGAIIDSRS